MKGEVLIIDNDRTICLIHKYLLKAVHSKEPSYYTDAQQALELIGKKPDAHHFLIYLDINMPKINGWDFLKKIETLENTSRFKIILVTSSVDEVDKKRAEKFDLVEAYIEKPLNKYKINSLKKSIEQFL